jgi:hypothetical protein
MVVFWVAAPCSILAVCQHFGGTLALTQNATQCKNGSPAARKYPTILLSYPGSLELNLHQPKFGTQRLPKLMAKHRSNKKPRH